VDEKIPDDRLLDWLWSFLTESTWAVSAHLPEFDLPASSQPTLDLASCEMAAFFAEAREVLKPWLDTVSTTFADSIIFEIDRRILTPYEQGIKVWWQDTSRDTNNWVGVCAGSILAACESLATQGLPRPEARERALSGLRMFLERGFTQHGECDEGVGYWNYGVGFACQGWSRLTRDELEREMDFKRLNVIADYPERVHLFDNIFFSGNDAGLTVCAPLFFVPWLGATVNSKFLARWATHFPGPGQSFWHLGQFLRTLDVQPYVEESAASSLSQSPILLEDQQVGILRASTVRGELIACLTGGSNSERHNHNDLGHFIVDLNKRLIIPDLGPPHYKTDFFGPNRYKYITANSRGHCCPLIGEYEQRNGKDAAGKVLSWEPAGKNPKLVLDLTAAYPPEAGLEFWSRSLELRPSASEKEPSSQMVIVDVFRTKEPNKKITHVLWSLEPFVESNQRAQNCCRWNLGPLCCEISSPPESSAFSEFSPEDLEMRDFKGRKLYRLHAEYQSDESGELKIETRFYPA
jgi:hypothetical protein